MVILKRTLQKYYKTLKKCFLVINSNDNNNNNNNKYLYSESSMYNLVEYRL